MIRLALSIAATLYILTGCSPAPQTPLSSASVIKGVNYIGVTVTDLDRATDFYTEMMDLELVGSDPFIPAPSMSALVGSDQTRAQTRMLRSVNAQFRLMQFDQAAGITPAPAPPVQGPGIAHLCFQVAQSTNMYQRALDSGATPIGAPELVQLIGRNPVYYGYAHDQDGILFEIEEVDKEKLPEDRRPPNDYRIRHVSLATGDMDRLISFYSSLLDTPNPRQVGGSNGVSGERFDKVSGLTNSSIRMTWFQVRNLELEIFEYVSHPPQANDTPRTLTDVGYNMIVFDVADLDAARTKFLSAGGTLELESEQLDGAPAFFGRDPDGNILAFQAAEASSGVSSQNFSGNGTGS